MTDPLHIGFVCSGNICRSPYAEAVLAERIRERGWAGRVETSSAGVLDIVGAPASGLTRRLAEEEGLDLSGHRSQGTTAAYLAHCDLVLTMEPDHAALLRHRHPDHAPRIYLLTAFPHRTLEVPEVPDPIGHEEVLFREVHRRIRESMATVEEALDRILGTSPSD